MTITNKMKLFLTAAVVILPAAVITTNVVALAPGSIQYKGADTVGPNYAAFNVFYDVPSVGNEADFIRVKKDGEANSALKTTYSTVCKTGDRFDVWFYVHNGANPDTNQNGSGPGVAKNVLAKVTLPQGEQSLFAISGSVTSSNTQSISDNATINCGDKKFKMELVKGSASAFLDLPNKLVPLPDSIVGNGTAIGTNSLDGNVWGCWEQRVWMGMKVEITEVVEPPKPEPVQTLKCEAVLVNRKGLGVGVTVNGAATNGASITGYKIVWGDGTADATTQTATHTYTKYDTKYTLKGYVKGKLDGKETDWLTSDKCAYSFSEPTPEKPQPPVEPPKPPTPPTTEELPNTGAGSVLGIAAAISAVGAIGHRLWTIRKLQ